MGAQVGLLVALATLTLVHVSVCEMRCSNFRNLDNGQTFFRYGGLKVIFRCHPGYKLHGHKTNSCVSGHWSRNFPVCVGSGCSHPGSIIHGMTRMNEDGSWAEFSCNNGFRLHGPLMIYCKGYTWNDTKPVCKEADIMSSFSVNSRNDLNTPQNPQIAAAVKNNQYFHFNAVSNMASKKANLRFNQFLNVPFHLFKGDINNLANPRAELTKHAQFSVEGTETTQGTRRFGSVAQTLHDSAGNLDKATQRFSPEDNFSSTVSSDHQTKHWTSSEPHLSSTPMPAAPAPMAPGELRPCSFNNGGCSQLCSYSLSFKLNSNETQTRTWCHCRPGFALLDDGQTCGDLDECAEGQHRCQHSCINTVGSFRCRCHDGYQPTPNRASCTDVDECLLPEVVTGCMFGCVNTPGSFYCSCPDGFSQLSADGHCQDVDECAVNDGLGPCMQRCHNLPRSYRCSCSAGYILAGDGHSCFVECPPGYKKNPVTTPENSTGENPKQECVDINECLENTCEWQCINLPGSHRCICPRGFTLQRDGQRCKDINECNVKNGGCSHLCVNRRGGYKCACPASHRMSSYSWKKCLLKTTALSAG